MKKVLAGIGMLSLVAATSMAMADVVAGTALYRERIALPPGAVFEAVLEDVSLADAPADVISSVRQEDAGNPPYTFELPFDPARIVPSRRYAVRARITQAGRLVFTSDEVHPVITDGHPTTVQIVMKRVATAAARTTTARPGELFATLPATFTGTWPCADCDAVTWHLELLPDGSYALRSGRAGDAGALPVDDIGRWAMSSDGVTLVLQGGHEAPLFLSVEDADTLRRLDAEGREAEVMAGGPSDLKRTAAYQPLEPALAMRGMFRYMADAALFEECATGRSVPVAMEGAYIDLERAYLAAKGEPGQPLMARVEGRLAMRPPMEGPGPVATLVVGRFLGLAPGETCPPRLETARLEDTYWKLVALGDDAVPVDEGRPEPHLVLRAGDKRASGSDGCNRFMAGYTVEADRIQVAQAASTMMACVEGMDVAQRFAQALSAAARWRVLGRQLELYGSDDRLLARFDARDLP